MAEVGKSEQLLPSPLDCVLAEWASKKRRMGCVSASNWLCTRVGGFKPVRKTYYTKGGEVYEHVVATNGVVEIDLAPYANGPDEE